MRLQHIIVTILLLSISSCNLMPQDPRDKIFREFKEISASMINADSINCQQSYQCLYNNIKTKQSADTSVTRRADTIYNTTLAACTFMDSLKTQLAQADSTGQSLEVTRRILTPAILHRLRLHMLAVSNSAYAPPTTPTSDSLLRDNYAITQPIIHSDPKMKQFFANAPSVAGLALLSGFQHECQKAAVIALKNDK